MRKIFYTICVSLICLATSCSNMTDEKMTPTDKHLMKVYHFDNTVMGNIPVRHAEYNGHHYLMVSSGNGRAILHDPDCPCN